ncbi:MAG TPA: hypothetical protein VN258_06530 [Mobilitalea sp.]|nr:hypothetical protein [Mobilitalea sp.]
MPKSSKLSVYDIESQSFIMDGVERTEVMDKFSIDSHTVSQYITMGYKLNKKYIICRQEDAKKVEKAYKLPKVQVESKNDDLEDRWNEMLELFEPLKKKAGAVK